MSVDQTTGNCASNLWTVVALVVFFTLGWSVRKLVDARWYAKHPVAVGVLHYSGTDCVDSK